MLNNSVWFCFPSPLFQVSSLLQLRLQLADKLSESVTHLVTLQCRVLDEELIRWKREQQLAGNGAQFNSNLDNIQDWYGFYCYILLLPILFEPSIIPPVFFDFSAGVKVLLKLFG